VTAADLQREPAWLPLLQSLAGDGRATCLLVGQPGAPLLWVTTERLPQLRAVHPGAREEPIVTVPAEFAAEAWSREEALRELVRSRLTALGPVTAAAIAAPLGAAESDVALALLALQQEGYVLGGRFSPDSAGDEWCERHLLARIHRYTLRRLRREIEPVERRDFARFLFDWQHLGPDTRVEGPDALAAILGQLEGFEAPAAAWEAELLPARVGDYAIAWLDDLCSAGRTQWLRLRPDARRGERATAEDDAASGGGAGHSLRATPLLLLPRRH